MELTIGKYREIFVAELLQSCLEFCNQVLRVRKPSLPGVFRKRADQIQKRQLGTCSSGTHGACPKRFKPRRDLVFSARPIVLKIAEKRV
jgi:hypothetical protein